MSNRVMDSYGTEDFVIPEIKLVQNVGGDEAKAEGASPGNFYCAITGEIIKGDTGFDITVVDIPKKRTYWGRDDMSDDPPVCSSNDGKISQAGDNCDECPYNARCDTPWLLTAQERRSKCLVHYNVIAIKESLPVLIRASGISTQTVRELMTQLRLNKSLKGEYHRAVVHVTSQKKKTASGEAFCMQMRANRYIEDTQKLLELKAMSDQILGLPLLPEGEPERQVEQTEAPVPDIVTPRDQLRVKLAEEPASVPPKVLVAPDKTQKVMSAEEAQGYGFPDKRVNNPPKAPSTAKPKTEPPKTEPPGKMDIDF